MKMFLGAALAVAAAAAGCAGGGTESKRDGAPPRDGKAADRSIPGTSGGPCYGNGTCNPGLTCEESICVAEVDAATPDSFIPSPDTLPHDAPRWPEARILEARVPDLHYDAGACTNNTDCDDGLACTTDICGVHGCENIVTGDACAVAGKCVAAGASNPANECEVCDPARATDAWSNSDEASCDDGDACTYGDSCTAGSCAGTPFSCDDGLDCTTDSCTGVAPPVGCTNALTSGYCAIMDKCLASGDTDPQASCLSCDPAKSATDWTIKPGFCFIDNTCHADGAANPLNGCEVCDSATKATTWSAQTPTPSPYQVMITEFLADPQAVSDLYGEWFEVYNASGTAVDLGGWTLKDEGSDSHVIQGPLSLGAGAYMVLARNKDTSLNGGVVAAYQYTSFLLSNLDDEIILIDSSCRPVDHVRYTTSWQVPTGNTLALRDPVLDNAFAANWCADQPDTWSGSGGDKGTPGAVNECPPPAVDAGPDMTPDTGPPPDLGPDLGIYDVSSIDASGGDSGAVVPCVTTGVVLDEVAVGWPDFVALRNRGTSSVSVVGYRLEMYGTSPYAPTVYTIAAADVVAPLAPDQLVYVFEWSNGTQPDDINTGANIPFYNGPPSAALPNAVALFDASGNLIDYVGIGDTIGMPVNVTFSAIAWPPTFTSSAHSFRRARNQGACPTFEYTDWGVGPLTR